MCRDKAAAVCRRCARQPGTSYRAQVRAEPWSHNGVTGTQHPRPQLPDLRTNRRPDPPAELQGGGCHTSLGQT